MSGGDTEATAGKALFNELTASIDEQGSNLALCGAKHVSAIHKIAQHWTSWKMQFQTDINVADYGTAMVKVGVFPWASHISSVTEEAGVQDGGEEVMDAGESSEDADETAVLWGSEDTKWLDEEEPMGERVFVPTETPDPTIEGDEDIQEPAASLMIADSAALPASPSFHDAFACYAQAMDEDVQSILSQPRRAEALCRRISAINSLLLQQPGYEDLATLRDVGSFRWPLFRDSATCLSVSA
jgi:hypothetical protein